MTATALRAARTSLALTQQQLADALDVHRITITRWETDAEPIPKMAALAVEALVHRGRNAPAKTRRWRN